jgi:hypothetical protein
MLIISTLNGQATLRVIITKPASGRVVDVTPIYYFNTSATGVKSFLSVGPNPSYYMSKINTLYTVGLVNPISIQPTDVWGNVKIPLLDRLSGNGTQWRPVMTGEVSYSSLIGSPIAGIPSDCQSEFTTVSSYFLLDCQAPVFKSFTEEVFWPQSNNLTSCGIGEHPLVLGSGPLGTTLRTLSMGSITSNSSLIQLLFQFLSLDGIVATNCTVQYPTVESQITCNPQNCSVTQMRPHSGSLPSQVTPLDDCLTAKNFYANFTVACGPPEIVMDSVVPDLTAGYIMMGSNPLSLGGSLATINNISELTGDEISERLTVVINTYWAASYAADYIAGGMTGFNFSNPTLRSVHPGNQTTGVVRTWGNIYSCDSRWFVILLITNLAFLLVSVAGNEESPSMILC